MRKTRIALVALVVLIPLGLYALLSSAQSSIWLSTSSPNKTYTVQFTGNSQRPKVPGIEHEARFSLLKHGERLVTNAYVDSYDWFDSDFAEMYPQHKWVTDSILRLGYDPLKSEQSLDSLTVSNDSGKPVRYLKITISDMLFVFDLQAHSRTELLVPHQGWLSWVSAEGVFDDGQSIPINGVNFFHRDKLNVPLRYCLTVAENAVRIESPVMDGYNGDATADKPNVGKVANCDSKNARP